MKNKLLKTLTCFAGIFAIESTIAITSTSCGSSSEKIIPLPESVYDIQDNVLMGFKDDFLNNQDSEIYQDNFKDCDTMKIPASVTSIGNNAFYNNSASTIPSFIKILTLPTNSNCSSIGVGAFRTCSSLSSIDFSNCTNLSTIDFAAFYQCSSLTSITFPSSLESVNSSAFEKCSSLTYVNLSKCSSLNRIYDYTFADCSLLSSIAFPSLNQIDNRVFDSCLELTSVTFPSNLKKISTYIFKNCPKLNDIKWESWDGGFESLSSVSFSGVSSTGERIITVTNPIDEQHNSAALLAYLKQNAGLPSNWTTA